MKTLEKHSIVLDGQSFSYIIEYKKIKNIYFRVKDDLIIYVSASKLVSKNYIESLLQNNKDAIMKMYAKALEKNKDNEELYYLGNKLTLILSDKTYISNDYIYAKDFLDAKNYIYSMSYEVFLARLKQIENGFKDLPDFKLKVRHMTSKWGVCNTRSMSITLNTELITKDIHLIDYVIVHELCHFKHMDHSASFWKEVSSHYPYYKEARKELNHQ